MSILTFENKTMPASQKHIKAGLNMLIRRIRNSIPRRRPQNFTSLWNTSGEQGRWKTCSVSEQVNKNKNSYACEGNTLYSIEHAITRSNETQSFNNRAGLMENRFLADNIRNWNYI